MRSATRFSVLTLGLAMLVGLSSNMLTRADDAPATAPAKVGTVSGKVVDADGKAVAGATVNAMAPADPAAAGGGQRQRGAAGGARPKPLATATTGDDGTFKLDAVPVGKVRLMARLERNVGTVASVDVTDGKDTKVDDIKLAPRAAGAGGGNGGGRRGGNNAPAPGGN